MLLFFRCTTFIGVCVEFVAAVAWLAELFADPHQREKVLGYTQAFSSIGGLLVAVANGWRSPGSRNMQLLGARLQFPTFIAGFLRASTSPQCARRLALHADVGPDSRDSADHHSTVPAGVAAWAARRASGHAQAAEHRGTVLAASCAARRSSRRSCSPAATAPRSARFSRCRKSFPVCR